MLPGSKALLATYYLYWKENVNTNYLYWKENVNTKSLTITEATELINFVPAKNSPQHWADLGCGKGTFSYALANKLPDSSRITCIDKSHQNINSPIKNISLEFCRLNFIETPLPFSNLHGILMANSLHFAKNKRSILEKLKSHLLIKGRFIIVEYDTSRSNLWVPYPISYLEMTKLIAELGFSNIRKIGERQSVYRSDLIYACEIIL